MFKKLRLKLSFILFLLFSLSVCGAFFFTAHILDWYLMNEFIKKGFSITRSVATIAGYSILAEDKLALDNIVSKLKKYQKDILYVTVIGEDGIIKAHSDLKLRGMTLSQDGGKVMKKEKDGSMVMVQRIKMQESFGYRFVTPIIFLNKRLGDIYIGMNDEAFTTAKTEAKKKIIFIFFPILSIGVFGILLYSSFVASPIEKLRDGISQLKNEKYEGPIRVLSIRDLNGLTEGFNEMAKMIMDQKGKLRHYAQELEEAYTAMVKILAAAIDARDRYTKGHSERVANLAFAIGQRLGFKEDELKDLEQACLVHDVGKIRIPDNILNKNSKLNSEEQMLMMNHTKIGAEILNLSHALHKYIPAVLYHHEWYNGKGYPEGLKGDAIPLFAMIIAISDSYDAMTSSRPYREGMTMEEAIKEIMRYKNIQFNPYLTDIFIEILKSNNNLN